MMNDKQQAPPETTQPLKRQRLDEFFHRGQMANLNGVLVVVHKVSAKEMTLRSVPVPDGFTVPQPGTTPPAGTTQT